MSTETDKDKSSNNGQMNLAKVRRQYELGKLSRADMAIDPFVQFTKWYCDAEKACRYYPNNMFLSTVDSGGVPHSRTVLLKTLDDKGFVFFTNYNSRKAQNLEHNAAAAITFFWEELERQVNISGIAEKVTDAESDEYFATRPRGSQIGAWVSDQSAEIADRDFLSQEQNRLEELYKDKPIPRPSHWGGIRILPKRIEFWQGQADRLHDRLEYTRQQDNWQIKRLSP